MPRWVYDFGEADPSKIELLGGKGANLAAMTTLGLPVPPGFTITTDAWRSFKGTGTQPAGLSEEIERHLGRLEGVMGRSFGDAQDPLLLSVRSGSPRSMPGMMDTILNVGLTDQTVEGLVAQTEDPSSAWDCYRRLVQMFSGIVMQVPRAILDEVAEMKRGLDGLDVRDAKRAVRRMLEVISETVGRPFPQDPSEQLRLAIEAVIRSWSNERARHYRRMNAIPDDLGTAATIQAMVFGNSGHGSGTGAYSFEAANPRHEHEYHVFEQVKLPDGKILIPGVISHTTNLVEHPELVAERIVRFAKIVGRENVIAGADCGFAASALRFNDTHPSVAWLKFAALAEGARLATLELWRG